MLDNPSLNQSPIQVRRALISVFDKTKVVELAQALHNLGIEILSTGGTAKALRTANVAVTDVGDYTQFPEIMDGRVKTINPLIEGGILGLRDQHSEDAEANQIQWIDLVVCNLYPFSETISREDCDLAMALENVDIGGPTMVRSAAKNVGWVCAVWFCGLWFWGCGFVSCGFGAVVLWAVVSWAVVSWAVFLGLWFCGL